jgi:hypothetical protein
VIRSHLAVVAVLAASLPAVGCGKPARPLPPMAEVSGTVTLKGTPLAQGDVVFVSEQGFPMAMKIVDGKYSGKAAVGMNRVQFSSLEEQPNPAHSDMIPGSTPVIQVNVIPAEFAGSSKLERNVEAGKTNSFDFTMK